MGKLFGQITICYWTKFYESWKKLTGVVPDRWTGCLIYTPSTLVCWGCITIFFQNQEKNEIVFTYHSVNFVPSCWVIITSNLCRTLENDVTLNALLKSVVSWIIFIKMFVSSIMLGDSDDKFHAMFPLLYSSVNAKNYNKDIRKWKYKIW